VLNSGQTFTYSFASIPVSYCVSPPQWLTVNAHFMIGFDGNTFDSAQDVVRVEAFENSTNEVPFSSTIVRYANWGDLRVGELWQDLQGLLRITVESGSVVLQTISVGAVTPKPGGGYCAYNTPPTPVSAPTLTIRRASPGLTVSWPAGFSNWVLETSTALTSSNQWRMATNAPVFSGDEMVITNLTAETTGFYRLKNP